VTVTIQDIIDLMERAAPSSLADSWDNPGLQIGKRDWPVSRVMTALDPSAEVIEDAIGRNIDLLITHHPLIFTPLNAIDLDTPLGLLLARAMERRLAVYAAHTNLDRVSGGLNDVLAQMMGLQDRVVLMPDAPGALAADDTGSVSAALQGMGRVGTLPEPLTLRQLALQLKERLGAAYVRIAGDPEMVLNRVALCTGSGASLLNAFYASGAQAYITGDLRYHDARTAEANGVGLLDIGHFSSELPVVATLSAMLQKACAGHGFSVSVYPCNVERDPFGVL
jgi:dinuclear metal center YbgI/SA1388 family protein